jgi:hypothetical protein
MVSNESATLGRVPTTKQLYFTRCVLDWRTGFIEYDYWAVVTNGDKGEEVCNALPARRHGLWLARGGSSASSSSSSP